MCVVHFVWGRREYSGDVAYMLVAFDLNRMIGVVGDAYLVCDDIGYRW